MQILRIPRVEDYLLLCPLSRVVKVFISMVVSLELLLILIFMHNHLTSNKPILYQLQLMLNFVYLWDYVILIILCHIYYERRVS